MRDVAAAPAPAGSAAVASEKSCFDVEVGVGVFGRLALDAPVGGVVAAG